MYVYRVAMEQMPVILVNDEFWAHFRLTPEDDSLLYHAEADGKSLDAFWIATIRKEATDTQWVEAKNVVQRSNNNTKKIT